MVCFRYIILSTVHKDDNDNDDDDDDNDDNNNNKKYETYFTGEITLLVAQTVNTEELQQHIP